MNVSSFVAMLWREKIVKKNLLCYTWTSGSQTTVHPLTIGPCDICLQWKTRLDIYRKWIEKMVQRSGGLISYGYYSKNDSSCPPTITFVFSKGEDLA